LVIITVIIVAVAFCCLLIIIIFYPRQSLFPAHTHTTHNNNSRRDRCRTFKYGGGVDHVTRHVWSLTKVKMSNVKVTKSRN